MVNTLIAWVLVGVFGFIWYWVGTAAPYVGSGGDSPADIYWFFTILAFAMMAGGK